jgi:branched-chain amino acid transport system ATP-binding protein
MGTDAAAEDGRSSAVLRLRGVTRDYGGLRAVDKVSLDVAPGERRAIIGPNGAGKTTLFRLISREESLTAGRVEFLGEDITTMPAHRVARRGLGRTYQITRIFPALTVEQNVVLAAQGTRTGKFNVLRPLSTRRDVLDKAHDCIARVGIEKYSGVRAEAIGHGRQRQLELGLALAADPRVLLLDEPGAGLSAAERTLMRDLVSHLPREITVLLIEHDMELALGLADYVLCMHNGKAVAEGTSEEIKADERVRDIYLGRGE